MSKHIGKLIAWSVTVVFIAVIALIATIAPGTEPVQAHLGHTNRGWCGFADANGELIFVRLTTHDVGFLSTRDKKQTFCEDEYGGAYMKNKQKEQIEGSAEPGLFTFTTRDDFPDGWFERPSGGECDVLPNSGAILGVPGSELAAQNRLQHVNVLKTTQLILKVVYDVASNEATGIAGAIFGTALGVARVATYVTQWNYDLQNECRGIVAARQTADIHVDTERIVTDVKTLLAAQDLTLRLYIEDHLATCQTIASLFLDDTEGLLQLTVFVVEDLMDRAEAAELGIGNAPRHLNRANDRILAGNPREGFRSLCKAYKQIVRGGQG